VKAVSPSVHIPAEAFAALGRVTTTIASGVRAAALLAVEELGALLAGGQGRASPPEGFRDPWPGSKSLRLSPHRSNPMKEARSGNR
jgi:hypothetical protein